MKKDCTEKKRISCSYCRKEGHTYESCWKRQNRNNQQQKYPFNQNKIYEEKKKIINGRPMKVFYVEEDELDPNEKLARTIEQLNKNLEKNLKV
jgi:hypothetical protein